MCGLSLSARGGAKCVVLLHAASARVVAIGVRRERTYVRGVAHLNGRIYGAAVYVYIECATFVIAARWRQ